MVHIKQFLIILHVQSKLFKKDMIVLHTSMLICCVYLSLFLDLMMLMLQLLLGIISGI